jgi:hypothetical protein
LASAFLLPFTFLLLPLSLAAREIVLSISANLRGPPLSCQIILQTIHRKPPLPVVRARDAP